MGVDAGPRDVWSDLVGGLLDARNDPATARFDEELAAAVEAGSVTPEAAHRLRFWQRASVRALADHARSVVPVALGALDAARTDATTYVDAAADVLGPVPEPAPEAAPEPAAEPGQESRPEQRFRAAERRASTDEGPGPSSLGTPSRLIVADLTLAENRPS